ncbi:MAG: type IV pili twitching motility protein PilT [Candidatus Lindowbacteria bacterium RIFCSPLOWO2_12_FULL_62_27]|nr:MAG: type IV pili twitching motility protein PilT [Candidatus Lindowbacteria bacterium RIFCSPLOWO2_12_FULL_62_27]
MYIHDVMELAIERGASDIHFRVGRPPVLRIDGELVNIETAVLTPDDTQIIVKSITPDEHITRLEQHGGSDYGYSYESKCRFRVSIFKERGYHGMVCRLIPNKIYSVEQLGLPKHILTLLTKPRGLVLVTGPTGSGKTTTLAAMIDWINTERSTHIITVEDPIEFIHQHKQSVVTHRELGVDVPSFKEALKRALRQDPDVIMVGELRDLETIEAAITAAETGHLVFGTLHTNSASATVDRIIDVFPTDQQEQIRTQLSVALEGVISQTLCPKSQGAGRVAAFEIMFVTPGVRNLIREMKTHNIVSAIQTGGQLGMQTMDQHLIYLYQRGLITHQEVLLKAQDREEIQKQI